MKKFTFSAMLRQIDDYILLRVQPSPMLLYTVSPSHLPDWMLLCILHVWLVPRNGFRAGWIVWYLKFCVFCYAASRMYTLPYCDLNASVHGLQRSEVQCSEIRI